MVDANKEAENSLTIALKLVIWPDSLLTNSLNLFDNLFNRLPYLDPPL